MIQQIYMITNWFSFHRLLCRHETSMKFQLSPLWVIRKYITNSDCVVHAGWFLLSKNKPECLAVAANTNSISIVQLFSYFQSPNCICTVSIPYWVGTTQKIFCLFVRDESISLNSKVVLLVPSSRLKIYLCSLTTKPN